MTPAVVTLMPMRLRYAIQHSKTTRLPEMSPPTVCLQVAVAVQGVLDGLGDMQVFTSAVFVDETTALVGCYDGSIYVFQGVLGVSLRTA